MENFNHTPRGYSVSEGFIERCKKAKSEMIWPSSDRDMVKKEVEATNIPIMDEDAIMREVVSFLHRDYIGNIKFVDYTKVVQAIWNYEKSPKITKKVAKVFKIFGFDKHDSIKFELRDPNGYWIYYRSTSAVLMRIGELTSNKPKKHTLVISRDARDILAASDHTAGWSSCYRTEDGEYSGSAVAMALNPQVFIAYVVNKDNEKIYRRFFYKQGDSIVPTSTAYPSHNLDTVVEDAVLSFFGLERDDDGGFYMLDNNSCLSDNHFGEFYFDDIDSSTLCGDGFEIIRQTEEIYCPTCDSHIGIPYHREANCCRYTERYQCDHCDNSSDYEEDMYYYDGECFCESCYNARIRYCEHCGENFDIDFHYEYYSEDCGVICERCRENYFTTTEDGDLYHDDNVVRCDNGRVYHVDSSDYSECEGCGKTIDAVNEEIHSHEDTVLCQAYYDEAIEEEDDATCEC